MGDGLTLASGNILAFRQTLPAWSFTENDAWLHFDEGTQMSNRLGAVKKINMAHPVFLMHTHSLFFCFLINVTTVNKCLQLSVSVTVV